MQSNELLRNTLREWAVLYNRKMTEPEADIWMRIFVKTPDHVLIKALEYVTVNAERMPTPGHLTKAIAIVYEQHPELIKAEKLIGYEGKDKDGMACVFWSDEPMTPAYRATDCAEGKKFLETMKRVAGRLIA